MNGYPGVGGFLNGPVAKQNKSSSCPRSTRQTPRSPDLDFSANTYRSSSAPLDASAGRRSANSAGVLTASSGLTTAG